MSICGGMDAVGVSALQCSSQMPMSGIHQCLTVKHGMFAREARALS